MDESTPQDQAPPPGQNDDENAQEQGFDPEQVENDPSHDPPISELKDMKGA
jgi:hypothetical protein